MKYQVIIDNPKSWFVPFGQKLIEALSKQGDACLLQDFTMLTSGDIAFFLSCEKIVPPEILKRNKNNIVIHASPLPQGKGMSPLSWQILEGKNTIPLTLFEAVSELDAGPIYMQAEMELSGNELLPEMHKKMGEAIVEMCLAFVCEYPSIIDKAREQSGAESTYPRRKPKDSELDVHKTLAEQFNLLRIVHNDQYPAFFKHRGRRYKLSIEPYDES